MDSPQGTSACRDPFFAATHWSVVLAARDGTSSQSREALEQKRGGQARHVPIESEEWEHRLLADPATPAAPKAFFAKQWALTILDRGLNDAAFIDIRSKE